MTHYEKELVTFVKQFLKFADKAHRAPIFDAQFAYPEISDDEMVKKVHTFLSIDIPRLYVHACLLTPKNYKALNKACKKKMAE